MKPRVSDDEIRRLIAEPKRLPKNWERLATPRPFVHSDHAGTTAEVEGTEGTRFRVIVRQNRAYPLDFSVILAFQPPGFESWFKLRRYNGIHPPRGQHQNRIERTRIEGFHIHEATLRYQDLGMREEAFATPTDRFHDLRTAIECLLEDCAFIGISTESSQTSFPFGKVKK